MEILYALRRGSRASFGSSGPDVPQRRSHARLPPQCDDGGSLVTCSGEYCGRSFHLPEPDGPEGQCNPLGVSAEVTRAIQEMEMEGKDAGQAKEVKKLLVTLQQTSTRLFLVAMAMPCAPPHLSVCTYGMHPWVSSPTRSSQCPSCFVGRQRCVCCGKFGREYRPGAALGDAGAPDIVMPCSYVRGARAVLCLHWVCHAMLCHVESSALLCVAPRRRPGVAYSGTPLASGSGPGDTLG